MMTTYSNSKGTLLQLQASSTRNSDARNLGYVNPAKRHYINNHYAYSNSGQGCSSQNYYGYSSSARRYPSYGNLGYTNPRQDITYVTLEAQPKEDIKHFLLLTMCIILVSVLEAAIVLLLN
jgi:hypothetical protein